MKNAYLSLILLLFYTTLKAQIPNYYQGKGRIAISTDGNQHDRDDYGATPAYLAFIAAAGLQDKLVHFQFSNHIWDSRLGLGAYKDDKEDSRPIMRESAFKAGELFNFDTSRFFEVIKNVNAATSDLTKHINNSSEENPLYILCGGPMEAVYRAVSMSSIEKRKYIKFISHSGWNDNHGKCKKGESDGDKDCHKGSHQKKHILELAGVNSNQWVSIANQNYYTEVNRGLNTSKIKGKTLSEKWAYWDFMLNSCHKGIRFTHQQMSLNKWSPDISDAGMAYYLLTGDEKVNPNKMALFLKRLGCDINKDIGKGVKTVYDEHILEINEKQLLFPIVLPEGTALKDVYFNSSDNNIASVTNTGLVKAKSIGNTTIKITLKNGLFTEVNIFVVTHKPKHDEIDFVNPPKYLKIYKDEYAHNFNIKYSAKGKRDIVLLMRHPRGQEMQTIVYTVNPGQGKLNLKFEFNELLEVLNNYQLTLSIRPHNTNYRQNIITKRLKLNSKIDGPPISIKSMNIAPNKTEIEKGTARFLKLDLEPEFVTNREVIWKSSNEKVAKVNNQGVVEGLKKGKTKISCSSSNSIKSNVLTVKIVDNKKEDKHIFVEQNGLLIIECENLKYENSGWKLQKDLKANGGYYLSWLGENHYHDPKYGKIDCLFKIDTPGVYNVKMYTRQAKGFHGDKGNDFFLGFEGNIDIGKMNKPLPDFYKYVNRSMIDFGFGGGSSDISKGQSGIVRLKIDTPGIYKLSIAARSKGFEIDRFVIFNNEIHTNKFAAQRHLNESKTLKQ